MSSNSTDPAGTAVTPPPPLVWTEERCQRLLAVRATHPNWIATAKSLRDVKTKFGFDRDLYVFVDEAEAKWKQLTGKSADDGEPKPTIATTTTQKSANQTDNKSVTTDTKPAGKPKGKPGRKSAPAVTGKSSESTTTSESPTPTTASSSVKKKPTEEDAEMSELSKSLWTPEAMAKMRELKASNAINRWTTQDLARQMAHSVDSFRDISHAVLKAECKRMWSQITVKDPLAELPSGDAKPEPRAVVLQQKEKQQQKKERAARRASERHDNTIDEEEEDADADSLSNELLKLRRVASGPELNSSTGQYDTRGGTNDGIAEILQEFSLGGIAAGVVGEYVAGSDTMPNRSTKLDPKSKSVPPGEGTPRNAQMKLYATKVMDFLRPDDVAAASSSGESSSGKLITGAWSESEIARLMSMHAKNFSFKDIGKILRRDWETCRTKLSTVRRQQKKTGTVLGHGGVGRAGLSGNEKSKDGMLMDDESVWTPQHFVPPPLPPARPATPPSETAAVEFVEMDNAFADLISSEREDSWKCWHTCSNHAEDFKDRLSAVHHNLDIEAHITCTLGLCAMFQFMRGLTYLAKGATTEQKVKAEEIKAVAAKVQAQKVEKERRDLQQQQNANLVGGETPRSNAAPFVTPLSLSIPATPSRQVSDGLSLTTPIAAGILLATASMVSDKSGRISPMDFEESDSRSSSPPDVKIEPLASQSAMASMDKADSDVVMKNEDEGEEKSSSSVVPLNASFDPNTRGNIWSAAEVKLLTDMFNREDSWTDIAKALHPRTMQSCKGKVAWERQCGRIGKGVTNEKSTAPTKKISADAKTSSKADPLDTLLKSVNQPTPKAKQPVPSSAEELILDSARYAERNLQMGARTIDEDVPTNMIESAADLPTSARGHTWSAEEDEALRQAVIKVSLPWEQIASKVRTHSAAECRRRWRIWSTARGPTADRSFEPGSEEPYDRLSAEKSKEEDVSLLFAGAAMKSMEASHQRAMSELKKSHLREIASVREACREEAQKQVVAAMYQATIMPPPPPSTTLIPAAASSSSTLFNPLSPLLMGGLTSQMLNDMMQAQMKFGMTQQLFNTMQNVIPPSMLPPQLSATMPPPVLIQPPHQLTSQTKKSRPPRKKPSTVPKLITPMEAAMLNAAASSLASTGAPSTTFTVPSTSSSQKKTAAKVAPQLPRMTTTKPAPPKTIDPPAGDTLHLTIPSSNVTDNIALLSSPTPSVADASSVADSNSIASDTTHNYATPTTTSTSNMLITSPQKRKQRDQSSSKEESAAKKMKLAPPPSFEEESKQQLTLADPEMMD